MPPEHLVPFRGCLKKIFFQSGPVELNLIQLADQGFGQSKVQTFGDLTFSCMPGAQNAPLVFSFNNGNNYTKLPPWRAPSRGTLAFQFRTLTPDGLLLYHGMAQCRNFTICDYLAFELIDGHLFLIVNLGSGDIRLQASAKSLHDGLWHSVVMERGGRKGFVSVDSLRTEFSCPGISANLDIDEPIFLGAVPWPDLFSFGQENENDHQIEAVTVIEMGESIEMKRNFPSSIWTINLRQGFLGCMKNIRLNGINIEIAHMFHSTRLLPTEKPTEISLSSKMNKSISLGCPFSFSVNFCKKPGSKNPCKNGGICSSYHNSFHCDCSDTTFDGISCQQKPRPLPFPLPESLSAKFHFSDSWQLEAENLEIKFRPKLGITLNELNKQKKLFVLIDTKSDIINEKDEDKQRLLVAITGSGGLIVHWVFQGNEQSTFNLSSANITNNINWHSLKLIRRGQQMGLKLDGKWHNQSLNNIGNKPLILSINEIAIAQPIGTAKIANNLEHLFRFHGDLRILSLNGHDLLRPIRVMKRQKGSSSSSQIHELNLNSSEQVETTNIRMENRHRNLSADHALKNGGRLRQTITPSQQLNNLSSKFQNDSISSVSPSFFFTKSPLGCLKQNARNCIPEPATEDSFFTPIISKSLNWEAQRITTSTITATSPPSPPIFQTSPPTKPTSVYSTKSSSSPATSTVTSTTTTRKRPHSWTRPKTKLEHFTFAPTSKPSTSTTTRKTLAPRFPVDPNDPTLYAVRPTTPMNGVSQYGNIPTTMVPSTSNNQLGDDKKFLIGVGSLSIVVMLGAILLCVFFKRPHQICAQMAAAAAGQGGAIGQSSTNCPKSGYTPIPPNEFSPQVQHHQMREFESNNNGVGARVGTLVVIILIIFMTGPMFFVYLNA
uniref:Uncharacterized protein n=1 Tax=Meloidogyne incognita TaxID=6306 RepID=A0A914MF02_MELIC